MEFVLYNTTPSYTTPSYTEPVEETRRWRGSPDETFGDEQHAVHGL